MRIEHIAVYVNDIESMKEFYVNYFGGTAGEKYENKSKGFESYFVSFSTGARLELMRKVDVSDQQTPNTIGLAHIAFSVGSKQEVDALTMRLIDAGCRHISGPRMTGDGYYESALLDKEGNIIEITE